MSKGVEICPECLSIGWVVDLYSKDHIDCPRCGGDGYIERRPKPRVVKMRKEEKYE